MKYIDADKLIHDLEERIYAYSEGYAAGDLIRKDALETLLKDIKHQCSLQQEMWRPSEKQMEALSDAYAEASTFKMANILESLYDDLKLL